MAGASPAPSPPPAPRAAAYEPTVAGTARAIGYPQAFEEGKIPDGEVLRYVKVRVRGGKGGRGGKERGGRAGPASFVCMRAATVRRRPPPPARSPPTRPDPRYPRHL